MNTNDFLRAILDEVAELIKQDMRDKNMIASGETRDSIHREISGDTARLYAADHFDFLVHGRGPGGMPPVENIIDWTNRKARHLSAWAVAKKIANEGTAVYRGEREGLKSVEEIIGDIQDSMVKKISELQAEDAELRIQTMFGQDQIQNLPLTFIK